MNVPSQDDLEQALTGFRVAIKGDCCDGHYLRGQVTEPAEAAAALHATLSRIAAEKAPDGPMVCAACRKPVRRGRAGGWIHQFAADGQACSRPQAVIEAVPAGEDPPADAAVAAVMDVLAPHADIDPDLAAMIGHGAFRIPQVLFPFAGTVITPTDSQVRALAEQIVTAIRASARSQHNRGEI